MTEDLLNQGIKTFNTLCQALDANNWHYQKNTEKLSISCKARGDDLPMDIDVIVDAERRLVSLLSHLPFVVAEDKRLDFAVAISVINYRLVDGSFDFNIKNGHVFFRMTSSYIESDLDKDVFTYMLMCSCSTIDDYNDKLLLLAKNLMSLQDFLADALD